MNNSDSRLLFVHLLYKTCLPCFTWRTGISNCVSSHCTCFSTVKKTNNNPTLKWQSSPQEAWDTGVTTASRTQIPEQWCSDPPSASSCSQFTSIQGSNSISLNIKVSIYVKNSCKTQEKQEGSFRPNKCIAGNKWGTDSLEAFYSNPVLSQHQLDQHTQEKHPMEMLTAH